jgi:hypothetical protein
MKSHLPAICMQIAHEIARVNGAKVQHVWVHASLMLFAHIKVRLGLRGFGLHAICVIEVRKI